MRLLTTIAILGLLGCSNSSNDATGTAKRAVGGPPGGGGGPGGGCGSCSNVTTPAHPTILVHGRNDGPARWNTLVSSWTSRGYVENSNLFRIDMNAYCGDNSFCSMLPAPDGTGATYVNESYANCLKRYIDEKVPTGLVDIVTHSQGGVVARYYARFLGASRIDDLVIMSAPNNGIQNCTLAGSCVGVNPEDCPDSAFLRKLNGVAPQGDGSNDETPNAASPGPVQYDAVVSTKDTVISPWCTAYFVDNPDQEQGDDWNCKQTNPTQDPQAGSCKISKQHLQIPSDQTAIDYAYCQVNND